MKKNYSIFIHAVHSRLQQIRNKLDFRPDMTPGEMVLRNEKYFELISESVKRFHDYGISKSEKMDAAELFLSTLDPEEEKIKKQPDWKAKIK